MSGQGCNVMRLCNRSPANQNGLNFFLIEDATVAVTTDLAPYIASASRGQATGMDFSMELLAYWMDLSP